MAGFLLQSILMKMMPSPGLKEQAELLRIQPLLEKISRPLWAINAVISDAERRTMGLMKKQDYDLDDWVAEVGATLVDLEDLLSSIIDRQEREAAESGGGGGRRSSSRSSAFLFPARLAFRRKLKKMRRSLDGLVERGNAFDLRREAMDSMDPFGDGYAAILKDTVEGRREEYELIMKHLQQQQGERRRYSSGNDESSSQSDNDEETFLKKNFEEIFFSINNDESSSERDNDEETFLKKNDEEKFYSSDNEYDEFVKMDGEVPFTIVISGREGEGKTTLAQMIYHDDWVRRHFHQYRFWVTASNFYRGDKEGIGREIARAMVGDCYIDILETGSNFQDMWVFADQCLAGRRYLLVLDDFYFSSLWRNKYWIELSRTLLSVGGPGSTIIITTTVNYDCYVDFKVNLNSKGISKDDWRKIFMRWAFTHDEQGKCKQQEEDHNMALAREISMLLCEKRYEDEYRMGGVLDAKWTGSIFRYTEVSKWKELAIYIMHRTWDLNMNVNIQHVDLLRLYLIRHKKGRGMFYHSLFFDDDIFTLEESMHLMIAQGLLPLSRDKDIQLYYIDDIKNRYNWKSMFQWVKTTPYCFTINLDKYSSLAVPKQTRHLCILFSSNNSSILSQINIERNKLQTLVLRWHGKDALLINGPNKCRSLKIPKKMFSKLRRIRALHLDGRRIRPPLDAIRRLHNLRYLNLSHTKQIRKLSKSLCDFPKLQILNLAYCQNLHKLSTQIHKLERLQILKLAYCEKLQMLPATITGLRNLQELNLQGCPWLIQLPEGIGNLKRLSDLNIHGCASFTGMPHGVGELTNLLRLSRYHVNDEFRSALMELQSLVNLIELRLEKLEWVTVGVLGLQKMTNLKYLMLHWQWWSVDSDYGIRVEPKASSLQELELLEDDVRSSRGDDSKVRIPFEQESSFEVHVQQLEDLEPYRPSLEKLAIISYAGDKLPSWMLDASHFESLREIKLLNLKRCGGLPPFPKNINAVEISGMNLMSIKMDDKLRNVKLTLSEMLNLEDLSGTFVGELCLIQCPKLKLSELFRSYRWNLSVWLDNGIILASESDVWKYLDQLEIVGCRELKFLPQGVKNRRYLSRLTIISCRKLISVPEWMAKALVYLGICNCPALTSIPSIPTKRLQEIRLEGCPKLQLLYLSSIPKTRVREIRIEGCPKLQLQIPELWHVTVL